MAKISARGCRKVAEFSVDTLTEDPSLVGDKVRHVYVLRSDGVILVASAFPEHPGGSYDRRRSGYRQWRRIKDRASVETMLAGFTRWHDKLAERYNTTSPSTTVSPIKVG